MSGRKKERTKGMAKAGKNMSVCKCSEMHVYPVHKPSARAQIFFSFTACQVMRLSSTRCFWRSWEPADEIGRL